MSIELGYAIQGRGGQAYWWLDNAGGTRWSALANYNFNLLPNAANDWASVTTGSFVLSTPFSLAANDNLIVNATMLTAHRFPYDDVGFGLLLKNSQIQTVLFALRPDGINHVGDLGAVPGTVFAAPSAGVTTTKTQGGPIRVVLGGVQYGQVHDLGDCSGTCSVEITSTVTPGGGTYQLLFGMFSVGTAVKPGKPAAMIVKYAGL